MLLVSCKGNIYININPSPKHDALLGASQLSFCPCQFRARKVTLSSMSSTASLELPLLCLLSNAKLRSANGVLGSHLSSAIAAGS